MLKYAVRIKITLMKSRISDSYLLCQEIKTDSFLVINSI